jgi:hypothetical protein
MKNGYMTEKKMEVGNQFKCLKMLFNYGQKHDITQKHFAIYSKLKFYVLGGVSINMSFCLYRQDKEKKKDRQKDIDI